MQNNGRNVLNSTPKRGGDRYAGFMFRLITTMKQGTASGLTAASARYATIEAARLGAEALFRNERVLRVMVVRNEIPPAFVEWRDR